MADSVTTQSKRKREENENQTEVVSKRHNTNTTPYSQIISLLEEDSEEPAVQDNLSSLITSLQQEIDDSINFVTDEQGSDFSNTPLSSSSSLCDDKERVMRHLLEASDDELGIPSGFVGGEEENGIGGFVNGGVNVDDDNGDNLNFFDENGGLWELEDVNANYYTLIQSQLFT